MARLKIRTGGSDALSEHQRQLLLHGHDLFERGPIVCLDDLTDADMARMAREQEQRDFPRGGAERAWTQHRDELMHELGPGERPAAFWRFDVHVVPPCSWFAEIDSLLQYDLISVEEAFGVEAGRPLLRPHDPGIVREFRAEGLGRATLRLVAGELDLAARWHAWRGRPGLAEYYQRRAEAVREVLEGRHEPRTGTAR